MALKTTIQFRRDHLSAWNEVNANTEGGLILKAGEIALVDLNNGNGAKNWVVRIGDGVTPFDQLPETAYALSADVAAQISAVISAHEADVAALQSQIANDVAAQISSVISSHEADVAALQKTIEDGLSGNSEALAEAKEELNGAIDSAKTELSEALSTADANLSAGIGAVKGELTALIDGVEDKVDNKIKVGDATSVAAIDTLTIKRVNIEEYHNILTSETIDDSTLYVVSSDNLNAFGSRVVQVGDAKEETDAVNLKQLNAVYDDLQGKINDIGNIAGEGIGELVSKVNNIISVSIPKLGDDISNVAADVSTLSNETIPALDGKINGVADVVSTLSGETIPGLKGEITAVSAVVSTLTDTTIPGIEKDIADLETSLSDYLVTVETETDTENKLKSWTIKQGGEEVATVELPIDIFISKGELVDHGGVDGKGKCLHLEFNDESKSVVEIPVNELVDIYTANNDASETIDVTIENFKVSAEVRDGAITTAKLDDAAVTEAKLADIAVTTAKLADNAITTAKLADASVTQAKLTGEFVFDCGGAAG
jgi:hypothetical protein